MERVPSMSKGGDLGFRLALRSLSKRPAYASTVDNPKNTHRIP